MNDSYQRNETSGFVLLGLTDIPEVKIFLFILFLVIYVTTLLGDAVIITLVILEEKLQNPMYFFLANFSFIDVSLISTIVPLFLINLTSRRSEISFTGCLIQLQFFGLTANMEFLLLAVMGYDRYVAICNPLRYTLIMSRKVCVLHVVASYVISILHATLYTVMTSQLSFCDSRQIHHFFCDVPPLLKISCSDTVSYQFVEYTEGFSMLLLPFLSIVASYSHVISAILKIRSSEGRRKAFSTCSSHLTLVVLLYSSMFFMYFRPPATYSLDYDRVVSVVYTAIIPMLNPFIYSLRNQDMTRALRQCHRFVKPGMSLQKFNSSRYWRHIRIQHRR